MKTSGLNPYLPFWETVPDGEPHVFGDRVYIYGSHDRLGGTSFCEEDYVCWSAPVEEPGVWTCEGVIYKKMQDPLNGAPYGKSCLRSECPWERRKIRIFICAGCGAGAGRQILPVLCAGFCKRDFRGSL